jgi:PAS domain S-box-containing protein
LPEIWSFIPVYDSAIAITDLITAAIFFTHAFVLRSPAILVLAAGYLFSSLMAVPHQLTFPGLFAPAGLLGAGPQTTAWLYMFWHAGFPLAVMGYTVPLTNRSELRAPARAIGAAIGVVVCAVAAVTALTTAGNNFLPVIMDGSKANSVLVLVVAIVWLLGLGALIALWQRRPHAVLDLWLMVVMFAWLCDVALSAALNSGRFDLGYYAGRAYGLIAATFVLLVLVLQMGASFVRLVRMFEAEQHKSAEGHRIFETSIDLILVVDRQGNLVRVSPSAAFILGYDPSEMVGRNATDFVHVDDLDDICEEMRQARDRHIVRRFVTRYIHKDGRTVTLSWVGEWSESEQRHLFVGHDIGEEQRISRMKDEFIATVSHELRTPVTSIMGALGLLAGGAAGDVPNAVKRLISVAQSNSDRLTRLVNDMLDIENIESGNLQYNFEDVALRPVVARAIEASRPLTEQFGVAVRLDPVSVDAVVRTDVARLEQVLCQLLSNAIKFSPRGEEAAVLIENRGDAVRIAIQDRGPGVPEDSKDLIFEKFVQVDATDTRERGGMGLGLNIVKQTMARLGGNVGYEAAPLAGSIFYIDVPTAMETGSIVSMSSFRAGRR